MFLFGVFGEKKGENKEKTADSWQDLCLNQDECRILLDILWNVNGTQFANAKGVYSRVVEHLKTNSSPESAPESGPQAREEEDEDVREFSVDPHEQPHGSKKRKRRRRKRKRKKNKSG